MAKTFHLTVARIGENVFDGEALSITLPGVEGVFSVHADHEPFVSELQTGDARIIASDGAHYDVPVVRAGIAEVSSGQATVLL